MKRVFLRWVAALWTLSTPGGAAPNDAPLIANVNFDLWSWNGTWKRLTTSMNIEPSMVLSPDGSRVAYLSDGWDVTQPLKPGEQRNSPFQVSMLEVRGGKARPLSGLRLERYAGKRTGYIEDAGLLAWSPAGTHLAWMSQTQGATTSSDSNWNMVIYARSSGRIERFRMRDVGTSQDILKKQLAWTARGLRVWTETSGSERLPQTAVRWYSPGGTRLVLEGGVPAKPHEAAPRLSLRDPSGPNSRLLDGARAPLNLGFHVEFGVTSLDGSRAVLAGRTPGHAHRSATLDVQKTPGDFQMWLYEAGRLRRVALPPKITGLGGLAWFGEIPGLR